MAEIKLVAIDLDGTLLDSNGDISPGNASGLRKAAKIGVRIILASTRNYDYVFPFCQQISLSDPVICSNGAEIYASPTGPLWRSYRIPIDAARRIAKVADENEWELSTTVDTTIYLRQRKGQELGFWKPNIRIVKNNEDALTGNPLKILVWQPDSIEYLERLCRDELGGVVLTERYYESDGELHSLGIFHPMGNKGSALSHILNRLSISRENVMAIGDNTSDLKMFSVAGISIAMGNATETVKKQADVIAPDNDSDGVAWVFDKYVLRQAL